MLAIIKKLVVAVKLSGVAGEMQQSRQQTRQVSESQHKILLRLLATPILVVFVADFVVFLL